jgi:hypothetical protein
MLALNKATADQPYLAVVRTSRLSRLLAWQQMSSFQTKAMQFV